MVLEMTLESPLDCKEIKSVHLKEIGPEYSLEGLMLKIKLQIFDHLPSVFPSIRVFSNESILHIRWSKIWSFIFSISPSNEKSGLISFMINGFDLLDVPGTLRSLLQHLSLKVSILQISPSLCSKSHIHT